MIESLVDRIFLKFDSIQVQVYQKCIICQTKYSIKQQFYQIVNFSMKRTIRFYNYSIICNSILQFLTE